MDILDEDLLHSWTILNKHEVSVCKLLLLPKLNAF